MSDIKVITQYLLFALGTMLGLAGISFIFIRFMAEALGYDRYDFASLDSFPATSAPTLCAVLAIH
ncbi:MAG: hypothetical protein R3F46_08475 [bacterium]